MQMTKLNTDPTSASAKPGTGAPSRAAAPPPTLFGPRTMDNHPWGRIIQREMDGTFDPALGKEAMAIAEPAPQDSDHGLQAEPDHFWLEAPELRDLAGTAAIPSTPSPSGRVAAQDPGPPSLTGEGISTSSHGVNEHMSLQVRHASPRDNHLPCAPVASGMGPQNISRGAAAEALPTYVAQQMDQAKGVQECPPVSDALPKGCTLEDLPNRARSPTLAQRSAIPHSHAFQGRRMQHGPASKADALQQPDLPAGAQSALQPGLPDVDGANAEVHKPQGSVAPSVGLHEGEAPAVDQQPDQALASAAAGNLASSVAGPSPNTANAETATSGSTQHPGQHDARLQAGPGHPSANSHGHVAHATGQQLHGQLPEPGIQAEQPGAQPRGEQHPGQQAPDQMRPPAGASSDAARRPGQDGQLWGGAAARVMRPTEALPPVSQLDASVLDALPLAMKRELEHAYGKPVNTAGLCSAFAGHGQDLTSWIHATCLGHDARCLVLEGKCLSFVFNVQG